MARQRLYAEGTTVPAERSRAEIEKFVRRYGANSFASGEDTRAGSATVMFEILEKRVRFNVAMVTVTNKKSEQENRRRWRALCLCIKAKLEAVASGIVTFEEEFLPHFVTASGQTVGEVAIPQYLKALESGKPLPPLLGM